MLKAEEAPMQCVPWACGGIRRIGLVAARGISSRGQDQHGALEQGAAFPDAAGLLL